jgi:hypothetical protein
MFTRLNQDLALRIKHVPTPEELTLLNMAVDAAARSVQRFRVGAASDYATAFNTTELHAETHMLTHITEPVAYGNTVAVARLGRRSDWRCSYPCPSCQNHLRHTGFRRLVCFNEAGQPVALTL